MHHKIFSLVFSLALMQAAPAQPILNPSADSYKPPSPKVGVATVKPSDPNNGDRFFTVSGRHFSAHNQTVSNLIEWAYGLQSHQLVGGLPWVRSALFDIEAVPDQEAEYPRNVWPLMLQQILTDRFGLTYHYEKRDLPVYILVQAKGGSKLTLTTTHTALSTAKIDVRRSNGIHVIANDAAMSDFAATLRDVIVGRPVINQSDLQGKYDFTLTFLPDQADLSSPQQASELKPQTELFTAIQEQLGLKLVPSKAAVDVFVIDTVAKPSAN